MDYPCLCVIVCTHDKTKTAETKVAKLGARIVCKSTTTTTTTTTTASNVKTLANNGTLLGSSSGETYWFYHKDRFACRNEDTEDIHWRGIPRSTCDDYMITAYHTSTHHTHTYENC